jgi:hypothetical protein
MTGRLSTQGARSRLPPRPGNLTGAGPLHSPGTFAAAARRATAAPLTWLGAWLDPLIEASQAAASASGDIPVTTPKQGGATERHPAPLLARSGTAVSVAEN